MMIIVALLAALSVQAKDLILENGPQPNDPTMLATASTQGQPCSPEDFQGAAIEAVVLAQKAGWKSVGGLPLEQIKTAIASTPVEVKCIDDHVTLTEGRSTARYDAQGAKRKIEVFNATSWPKMDRESQRALSLHEHLGVLGFPDDTYQTSLRIGLMPAFKPGAANPLDKTLTPLTVPPGLKGKGGSTVVGGGGDGGELQFRAGLISGMTSSLDRLDPKSQQFRRALVLFDDILRVNVVFDPQGFDAPAIFSEPGREIPSVRMGIGYYEGRDRTDVERELAQAVLNAANRAYETVRASIP